MARLFLDANVLFSAAYRSETGLLKLWKLREVVLCSSRYALEEARINLNHEVQRTRLVRLAGKVQLSGAGKHELPEGVSLPEKDVPILLAPSKLMLHILAGDLRHFGSYFGKRVEGILVLPPGEYLSSEQDKRNWGATAPRVQILYEFQDRILFGTDAEPVAEMYSNYFRWLETQDEYFPYWGYPEQGRWEIYGLGLPDQVLEKVYHGNAEQISAQFGGGH